MLHETPPQGQWLEEFLSLVGVIFHEITMGPFWLAKPAFHFKRAAASSAKADAQTSGGNDGASVYSTKRNMKKDSLVTPVRMISLAHAQLKLDQIGSLCFSNELHDEILMVHPFKYKAPEVVFFFLSSPHSSVIQIKYTLKIDSLSLIGPSFVLAC